MSNSIESETHRSSPSPLAEALFMIAVPIKLGVVQKIYVVLGLGHTALPYVQAELVLAALRNLIRAVKC